ncbi:MULTISPECIES: hypothetical protein [Niastella]|uniref:Knr4/Smi1-like domain-containing protein n=1 Tax=Niastella soli TaxID=2821487 RepID=A0ABS3Z3X4_9BACT|nr:hypothetical protein [Niastella soli]MBO9204845.1 hypothetical protein [Niastella soli]
MNQIPEDYTDFLYWVKETTESFWAKESEDDEDNEPGTEWLHDAKWIGLSENEIDDIEKKYSIKFNQEHRAFLRILHAIDRKEEIMYKESFDENSPIITEKRPFFYNWLEDETEIKERFEWPYRTILQDVLGVNGVWLQSWGPCPQTDEDKTSIFLSWFNKTPRLLPVRGHRFSVSDPDLKDKPVLSVWGSDIIVYGWNFRHYLLHELEDHLGLWESVYDEEDECFYSESNKKIKEIYEQEYTLSKERDIPFWKEMIMYWSSGWYSFGLEYPQKDNSIRQPIVKANLPDDKDNNPKTFNSF